MFLLFMIILFDLGYDLKVDRFTSVNIFKHLIMKYDT